MIVSIAGGMAYLLTRLAAKGKPLHMDYAEKAAADALAKVKEFEDRDKTELEKLTDQISKAKAEADQARAEALRLKVAAQSGLPADLHEFLVGNDEEELRAKAQKLMAATAAATDPRRPAPDPTQGAKPGSGLNGWCLPHSSPVS